MSQRRTPAGGLAIRARADLTAIRVSRPALGRPVDHRGGDGEDVFTFEPTNGFRHWPSQSSYRNGVLLASLLDDEERGAVRIAVLLLTLLTASAYAGVYSCIAPDGRTKLQSTPCKRGLLAHVKVQPPPVDPKQKPQVVQPLPTVHEEPSTVSSKECHMDQRGWMACSEPHPGRAISK